MLEEIAEKREYKDKEVIINTGEEGSSLYAVTSGSVEQRLYYGPRAYKILSKLSPGTFFGKQTFFNPGPMKSTAVALGDTIVYKIRRSDIEGIPDEKRKDSASPLCSP